MDIPDAALGRLLLAAAAALCVLLALWLNTYPFIDDDTEIYKFIPDPQWFLLFCAVWGLFFIGGLMSFTFYHIRPYLGLSPH